MCSVVFGFSTKGLVASRPLHYPQSDEVLSMIGLPLAANSRVVYTILAMELRRTQSETGSERAREIVITKSEGLVETNERAYARHDICRPQFFRHLGSM